jgi:hypothetical protein
MKTHISLILLGIAFLMLSDKKTVIFFVKVLADILIGFISIFWRPARLEIKSK